MMGSVSGESIDTMFITHTFMSRKAAAKLQKWKKRSKNSYFPSKIIGFKRSDENKKFTLSAGFSKISLAYKELRIINSNLKPTKSQNVYENMIFSIKPV